MLNNISLTLLQYYYISLLKFLLLLITLDSVHLYFDPVEMVPCGCNGLIGLHVFILHIARLNILFSANQLYLTDFKPCKLNTCACKHGRSNWSHSEEN